MSEEAKNKTKSLKLGKTSIYMRLSYIPERDDFVWVECLKTHPDACLFVLAHKPDYKINC